LRESLISLQSRSGGSAGGASREEHIATVADSVQEQVPDPFDSAIIKREMGNDVTPIAVVLLQELEHWNKLVVYIRNSLKELKRALAGEVGMSSELDDIANALFNGAIPPSWRRICPQTEKGLGSWMLHFNRRQAQYSAWVKNGAPLVLWLPGLHIPATYIAATVQMVCRAKKWPLDRSTLYTKVTCHRSASQVQDRMQFGCYVNGLYLEGARWNQETQQLDRQLPKMLVEELNVLQIIPTERHRLKLVNTLRSPVYVTQQRRNAAGVGLVFEADLDTTEHSSLWVLQGVALCLNIAD